MSAVEEARKTMEDYFAAFNAQNEEAIRKHFHFPPFSWIINTRVRTIATAADFESPTKTLVETEGWHHSAFDYVEPVQVWGIRFISSWRTAVTKPTAPNT
jgi:primosomal protein N'